MNLLKSQNRIIVLMSRFVDQVNDSTAMARTDINKVAETILTHLLAEVYDYRELKNLNSETNNYPGIDLGDEKARVAFQITSTSDNEKIKDTLGKFVKYELYRTYATGTAIANY
ncbi:SMEK domain-containing protein [Anabaena sp. FACHB-1237]|uniref:SMEK domain-containing protein n=1 Tax=Anabaena sp. FACHB-1237 TaxID=2692769 RepID=UPI00168098C4|nr:SMEK domain-containing protein [Anabaena sp. FACHB-1237]MBD2139290.1 SMEK domain-containing protein [Anabaena sp. FACHB-1237]